MIFQNVNQPLDRSISGMLGDIISKYRYNMSNWILIPGSDDDDREWNRVQSEWLLSTYTKRFMVLMTRFAKGKDYDDTKPEDRKNLPLYKAKVNCFIDGDYQHTVTQTNGNGYKQIDGGILLDDDYKILYYSWIVFDFTPNEVKNSITVTDLNGIPSKGLFTLELLDSDDKKVTYLPHSTNMRFIMIGSGIDTSTFSYPTYKQELSDSFFDVLNDVMRGQMIGYTKGVYNTYELDNGLDYPMNQFIPQNIILPIKPYDLNDSAYDDIYFVYNRNVQEASDGLYNNLLRGNKKECLIIMDEPDYNFVSYPDTTLVGRGIQLANRRNSDVFLSPSCENMVIHLHLPDSGVYSVNCNNILLVERASNIYSIDGLLPDNTPLLPPQVSTLISNDRPLDDGICNHIYRLYANWFKNNDYRLTYTTREDHVAGQIFLENDIKEVGINMYLSSYADRVLDIHDIELESWNSDTTHNIYIDFIF